MKPKSISLFIGDTILAISIVFVWFGPSVSHGQTLTQHWKMDEASLTYTASLAPLINNGSLATAGAVHNAADIPNNPVAVQAGATAATGTSIRTKTRFQRIQLGNSSPTTGAFTVGLWFRRDGTASGGLDQAGGDQEHIISGNQAQAGRWNLSASSYVAATKSFDLGWFHNGGLSPTIAQRLSSNTWYHIAVTREMPSGAIKFYLNGQLMVSGTDTATFTNSTNGLLLGRDPGFSATNRGFVGNFDDIRFYNGAVSQSSVINTLVGDSDSDGLPDIWEISNFILSGEDPVVDAATILARHSGVTDADSDTLDNLAEFTALTNPNLADTDSDGLNDNIETNTGSWVSASNSGTKPLKADSDGDGLLDGQENNSGSYVSVTDTGTNPNLSDTDADTFNDYLEIARSTNPVSNTSMPGSSSATPLVELSAMSLPAGSLSSWPNTGTIGKSFEADFGPTVETVGGVKGVTFFGGETMTGPVAPSNLTGGSPRTIEAWIFNPSTSTEETIVAWGRRDGTNGTSSAFFHGTNTSFGAVGNWGTPDMAWGPDAPAIATNVKLGSWTYVVYTYDGGATNVGTVYSNASLANTEALGVLNTWAVDNSAAARPLPIRIAGQNAANGTLATAGQKGSLTIAKLRIHDRVVPTAEMGFSDADSDGMKDWYEDFYGLNKLANDAGGDPDIDGLTNLQEQAAGTNPSIADTDDDAMPDGWEFANFGNQSANPGNDADNDGSTNLEEYEALTKIIISRDANGDITGTASSAGSSNPNDANSQPDTEPDGLPDGWEFTYLTGLSEVPGGDTDGDTFDNLTEFTAGSDPDNVLSTPSDADGDGLADAWEETFFVTITAQNGSGDPDGDGATNEAEETGASDPNDPNSQPDNDADGLPDGYELVYFGDLDQGNTSDFDGDTYTDLAEYTGASNPIRSGNTPVNVHNTVTVAVASSANLDEWTVTDNVWTKTRSISPGGMETVIFHNNFFYGVAGADVVKVDPNSGVRTVFATRNTGDALTAGWTDAGARDIGLGPDGKLYFTTTFGASTGQGVFRLNLDGTGFERFIARTGGVAPNTWELSNAIGLAWHGNDLYVSSRAAFGAVNRPIYKFDTSGALVSTFIGTLNGPMGLCIDGSTLVVGGADNASALVSLNLADASTNYVKTGVFSVAVGNILGELHTVTFSNGTGGNGSILKAGPKSAMTVVNANLTATASDFAVFASTATPYEIWAQGFGIDPNGPGGGPADDFDGDETPNGFEFALALNPADGKSRFAASQSGTPATGITLTWPSAPGISFTIRSSTDLTDWATVEATVPASASPGITTSWTSGPLAGSKKFFRVEFTQ